MAEAPRAGEPDVQARKVGEQRRRPPIRATVQPGASRDAKRPPRVYQDAAFRRAWRLLQAGRYTQAARAFDALGQAPGLDPGRRADVLYWSAKAHQLGGEWRAAQARAGGLAERSPDAWHAPDAALLMGESLALQGDFDAARRWLSQALSSDRHDVRTRARELLRQLDEDSGSGTHERQP